VVTPTAASRDPTDLTFPTAGGRVPVGPGASSLPISDSLVGCPGRHRPDRREGRRSERTPNLSDRRRSGRRAHAGSV